MTTETCDISGVFNGVEVGRLSSASGLINCYQKELKEVILLRFEYSPSNYIDEKVTT